MVAMHHPLFAMTTPSKCHGTSQHLFKALDRARLLRTSFADSAAPVTSHHMEFQRLDLEEHAAVSQAQVPLLAVGSLLTLKRSMLSRFLETRWVS